MCKEVKVKEKNKEIQVYREIQGRQEVKVHKEIQAQEFQEQKIQD